MSKVSLEFIFLLLATLLNMSLYGQYFGDITSVVLSDQREVYLSDYTITATAALDQSTGNSLVAAGNLTAVVFPVGFDINDVSGASITIANVMTPITGYYPNGQSTLIFNMPVDLPVGSGFELTIQDVRNANFNSACGATVNTYASSTPCDGFVQVLMLNALNDQQQPNVYHHFTLPRFEITQAPHFISDIDVDKPNLGDVPESSVEQEMVRVKVSVAGTGGALPELQGLSFSSGSTLAADILEAQIWATGSDPVFHGDNDVLLGSTTTIGSNMNSSAVYQLVEGDNYFWLIYDIACYYGLQGHTIDGNLNSLIIDNQAYTPATPAGTRTIIRDLSLSSVNLVPNPSFEEMISCPEGIGQIVRTAGWDALPITAANFVPSSPDYFNRCDPTNSFGDVPVNGFGLQEPRTGDAYAGIYASGFFDWKEYLQIELSSPLQAGETYAVTYYISGGDYDLTSELELDRRHDGFGFMFSNSQVTSPNSIYGVPSTLSPQYISSQVVTDHVDWVPISSTYTAVGGEEWLVIGCFLNYNDLNIVGGDGFGYYYIDDVRVAPLDNVNFFACQGIELLIESTGESCPGAADGSVDIEVFGGTAPHTISWSDNGSGFQRSNLAAGTYSVTVTDANNTIFQDQVFIQPAAPLAVDMMVASTTSNNNGSINAQVTNGISPYTYAWSTGATIAGISNLATGTYQLTVTDAAGCSNTFSTFVGEDTGCSGTYSNFPYEYDTELKLGLFKQNTDDDGNWRRRNSPTPTNNTGPSAAYTGAYYRYVESSGNNSPNKTAVLTTKKCLDITNVAVPIFSFYYNMNGVQLGELFVQLSTDGGSTWTGPVWSTAGDQGDNWQQAIVFLDGYISSQLRIRVVGVTGTGALSDMAIDSYYIGTYTGNFLQTEPSTSKLVGIGPAQEKTIVPFSGEGLIVYPNPAKEVVNLRWTQNTTENVHIHLVDQLGREVYQVELAATAGQQEHQINLKLTSGLYIVEIQTIEGRQQQLLVVY